MFLWLCLNGAVMYFWGQDVTHENNMSVENNCFYSMQGDNVIMTIKNDFLNISKITSRAKNKVSQSKWGGVHKVSFGL